MSISSGFLYEILKQKILACEKCHGEMEPPPSLKSPKFLDCSHTFCLSCLEGLLEGDDIFCSVVCPCCFEETTVGLDGVASLPDNLTVIRIIEVFTTLNEDLNNLISKTNVVNSSDILSVQHDTFDSEASSTNHISSVRSVRKSYLEHQQPPKGPNLSIENDSNKTIVLECSPNRIGRLIGLRGATIKSIRSRTKCFIDIQKIMKPSGEFTSQISVSGTPERVAEAYESIINILKINSSLDNAVGISTATSLIEASDGLSGIALNLGGTKKNSMTDHELDEFSHNVHQGTRSHQKCGEPSIVRANSLDKADLVLGTSTRQTDSDSSDTTIEGGGCGITMISASDSGTSVRMECGLERIGRLLGLKGGRIKSIRVKSGAKIVITKEATCVIDISGSAKQVKLATALVRDVLTRSIKPGLRHTDDDAMPVFTGPVTKLSLQPSDGVGGEHGIVSASPKSVSDVEDDVNEEQDMDSSGRTVQRCFSSDSQSNRSAAVALLDQEVEEDWYCPHAKVAAVIGRRGTVIREIKRRTNCVIVIHNNIIELPDKTAQRIVFRGLREEVAAAMTLVQAVIELGPVEGLQDC